MHLKRIEVYGFKSFADKLRLDFNDGVTCIVGPNGCGKSNVSDAIRWVLGEQRASDMRTGKGNKMDQVIFKGTSTRKAMGFCEVSLTFDNTDKKLPLDTEEVRITRKMYRTGESEYYINNHRDKLKNLIDLFRDTGIGKDGYSVIGQGKIDSFLTAKPENRRQIFEEAAGISKYKANRSEAMKSLEKTQINLELTATSLREKEEQIGPLEKQAAIATEAAQYKARIKELEINHFLYVTENSENERKHLQTKLDEANEKLEKAIAEQADTKKEYEDVTQRITSLDDEFNAVHETIVRLTKSAAIQSGEQKRVGDAIGAAEKFIEEKKKEIDEKREKRDAASLTKKSYSEEYKRVYSDLLQAKADELKITEAFSAVDAALKQKREQIKITNSVIYDAMNASLSMTGDLAQLKAEKIGLEKDVEKAREQIELKEEARKAKAKEIKEVSDRVDALKKAHSDKERERSDTEAGYFKKADEKKGIDEQIAELKDTLAQVKMFLTFKENSKTSYANYEEVVKNLMTCGIKSVTDKILGVVGNVITVSPKYALAVETALGNNINNMITRNQEDTSELIDFLTAKELGRGTFLPLTDMRPKPLESVFDEALEEDGCVGIAADLVKCDRAFRPAIETLLGRVVIVEDKPTAIRMTRKYAGAFRMVTLQGDNYAVSGAVTGGRKRGGGNRTLTIDADIEKYKKEIEDKEAALKELLKEQQILLRDMSDAEKASDVLTNQIVKLEKDLVIAEQSKQHLEEDAGRIAAEIDALRKEIEQYQNQITLKSVTLQSEQSKMGSQTDKTTNANELLDKMNGELSALQKEYDETDKKRTEILASVKELEVREKELNAMIASLEKDVTRLEQEMVEGSSAVIIREAELERLRVELEKLVLENTDDADLLKAKERKENIVVEKAEKSVRQGLLYTAMNTCADKVNEYNEKKARAETQLDNLQKEIETVREKVKEDYGLDYDSAQEWKIEDYDDAVGGQEVKLVRKELLALGDINERAIADLAEKKKEYDETKLHYDDVLKARDMLNETIADLTKTMEKQFSESFEKIKVNFASVFSEMFDGGKGRLDLDQQYGQSILDAGIVVEAEPPGKKLQNIDLLSGGERALTAIAIIFAIIKLNPVPFCILDEVDAPLDDSNSSVYAKYLRKFSKNTQFIIVSHRKPTMELANVLYGITMQEKGVSKVFSVKLSEAMKMAQQARGDTQP